MNADQLNHDAARRQEGTMSDEARKVLEEFAKPVSFGAPMWDERKAVGALLAENAAQAGLIAKLTGWDRERTEQLALLSGFKSYVHQRLDEAGIPTHPDGPHSKEGCRIGDRLDIVFGCLACAVSDRNSIFENFATMAKLEHNQRALKEQAHSELAAAKAENERLKVENAKWPSQWIREIDKAVAAERAAQDGAALAALRKEQDAFNAEVRELQDINAKLLSERDAALAAIERLKDWNARHEMVAAALRERDAAVQVKGLEIKAAHDELRRLELRIADLVQARDIAAETAALAVQAKERAEADAAILLDAMRDINEVANVHDAVEIARDQLHARQAGAALLEERDRYKAAIVTAQHLVGQLLWIMAMDKWEVPEHWTHKYHDLASALVERSSRLEPNATIQDQVVATIDALSDDEMAALAQQPDQRPTKE